jgi:DNA-binding NtrC family response regulator
LGSLQRQEFEPTLYESIPIADILMSIYNILVVDDDIAVCRIVQRMLSHEQYKIQTSHSVSEALGIIEKRNFDVYVMDYKLPDGSGLDIADRIRSRWGATPIILISGYDPGAVALRAEKLRISDFLEKPFSREIICNAVKKAIASPPQFPDPNDPGKKTPGIETGKSTQSKPFWSRLLNIRSTGESSSRGSTGSTG